MAGLAIGVYSAKLVMTGPELYDLTTELLGGKTLDVTLFYQLLNMAKNRREAMRPWVILRKVDSSLTVAGGDGITNTKALPTRFIKPYSLRRPDGSRTPVVLRTGDSVLYVSQIQFGSEQERRDDTDLFFIDLANNRYAFTGIRDQSYTIYFSHLAFSVEITAQVDWVFPSQFHPILAFDVAVSQKGGIDWDELNARMAQYNGQDTQQVWSAMVMWDTDLQRQDGGY